MPKNPLYADKVILKNGGVIETEAGTDIIAVDAAGSTVTITGTETVVASEIALADGKVLIGAGTGLAVANTISGDASIINTGAITVTGSTGAFAVGTKFSTGNTTTSTGAGAVAVTGAIHEITTTGAGDALTLADGTEGQHLYVVYVAEGGAGDTAVCTPVNLAGANTTVTFTDLGDSAHLLFTAGAWYFLGGEATVA